MEVAAPCEAGARHCVPALAGAQGQLDALLALLSAVKEGDVGAAAARTHLSRSPHGVGGAMDPVCTLRVIDASPNRDTGMVLSTETDVDPKMVKRSRCQ